VIPVDQIALLPEKCWRSRARVWAFLALLPIVRSTLVERLAVLATFCIHTQPAKFHAALR
jgi:hypothetical protein